MTEPKRNPLIIPVQTARPVQACSKCGGTEFTRRHIQGVVVGHCKTCGEETQGGLPQLPQDHRVPYPAESYVPPLRFEKDLKGGAVEVRRRVDSTTDFRKGAPIPEPGEEW